MTIWSYVYDVFLYINRVIQPKSRTRGPKSTDFSQLILIKSPTCASATTTFTRKPKQFGTVIRRPFLYVVKIPDSLLFGSSRNMLYQFAHSALLQRCLPSWNPWKRRAFATPRRHTLYWSHRGSQSGWFSRDLSHHISPGMELRAWCLSKHRKTMGKPSNAERSLIFFDMRRVSVWYTQTHLAQKWSNSAMGLDESQDAFGWVLLTSHLVYIPPALLGYRPHEIIRRWSHVPIIWLATNSIINNNNNNLSLEQWQCLAKKTYPCAAQVVACSKTSWVYTATKNVHPFGTKQNVGVNGI